MRLGLWLIVAVIALCAGMFGAFLGTHWHDRGSPKAAGSLHAMVHRSLDLTASQRARLDALEQRYKAKKTDLEADLKAANRALARAIDADNGYSPRVARAVEAVHDAMGALQKLTIRHVFNMRAVLTAEQAEVFDAQVVDALTRP
ncbi:hypothetical protein CCR85_03930 [Rhodothalassium salexigens]|uniref:Spy/CpxP family protein refolding chaperone n=1 Tax=Rhodothalassium salexigens TaxID=1086 RepID=UPI001912B8C8|nr:periplasmic heavy metal sensor [Rhodothalassium salexigens]MBK5910641.1 hypothetical protein [Rhodothalassium salexigens]MBK5920576.1 hypothetical protein [Rhodothalassium salexigens]